MPIPLEQAAGEFWVDLAERSLHPLDSEAALAGIQSSSRGTRSISESACDETARGGRDGGRLGPTESGRFACKPGVGLDTGGPAALCESSFSFHPEQNRADRHLVAVLES